MPKKVRKKYKVLVAECLTCGWNTKVEVEGDNVSFAKFEVKKALNKHLAKNGHTQSNIRVFERTKTEKEPTELEQHLRNQRRAEEHAKERKKKHGKVASVFLDAELEEMDKKQNKALRESKRNGEWTDMAKALIGNRKLRDLEKYGFFD